MSDRDSMPPGGGNVAPPAAAMPLSAGTQLALARQAAGLTQEAVAVQLKLAPRQVKALEDDDYEKLPGRTFVRGFVRNYARLMHLDPNAIVDALPDVSTPSLDSPALHPTAPTMGELPATERNKSSWTRWAIPLILIAVIAGAAVYEYLRDRADTVRLAALREAGTAGVPSSGTGTAPGIAGSAAPAPGLPPSAAPSTSAATPAPAPSSAAPAASPGSQALLPGVPLANPLAGGDAPARAPAATPPGASAPVAPPPTLAAPAPHAAPAATGTASMVLTYRAAAWTEVKDRTGNVLVSQIVPAGQTQTLNGTPPFDVVIGNATAVGLSYRGTAVDLAPYTQKGVARFSLE